jgi:hypothetical protein
VCSNAFLVIPEGVIEAGFAQRAALVAGSRMKAFAKHGHE